MTGSGDQTWVGRTLTLGGGVESSLEGRDVELLVSPKDIRTSPYDLCATAWIDDNLGRGTDGSNPLPPTGESVPTSAQRHNRFRTPASARGSGRRFVARINSRAQ